MRLITALGMIANKRSHKGYMVHYEWIEDGRVLRHGYFPDRHLEGETVIASEEEAWRLATEFAKVTEDKYFNIYVVDYYFNKLEPTNPKILNPWKR